MKSVILSGKIVWWLIGPVYKEMQAREKASNESEDEQIYWANDYPLYGDVLNQMLDAAGMQMIDLEYQYGDIEGNPIPRHPEIDDADVWEKIKTKWSMKTINIGQMAHEMKLNYEQIIRVLNKEWHDGKEFFK